MPAKRTVLDRPRRRTFSGETLALFCELDATLARDRERQDFKDKEHELARLLDLVSEYWTTNSVCPGSAPVRQN